MTEQEREELKRKIEVRKNREAAERAGTMNSNQKTCPGCGSVIPANYDVCPVCGKVLRQCVMPKQQGQAQSGSDEPGKGFAIASLVLGCVGVLLVWFFPYLGPVCGGIGYALADKAKEKGCQSGLTKAGRILSITSMAISLVIAVGTMLFALIMGLPIGGGNGAVFATLLGVILVVVIELVGLSKNMYEKQGLRLAKNVIH